MIIASNRVVILSPAETVIKEWHNSLLDEGYSESAAVDYISARVPEFGTTYEALLDSDFFAYLSGDFPNAR